MNIEVGKFYRLRCGGAVRIVEVERNLIYAEFDEMTWFKYGEFALNRKEHPFDLIAEITEAEYNRIIAGEAGGSFEYFKTLKAENNLRIKQTEYLTAENARLTSEVNRLSENTAFDRISERFRQDERRFEAAKSAMMGILATPNRLSITYERTAIDAIEYADALLKALEESK
jgi:hypothetical protein